MQPTSIHKHSSVRLSVPVPWLWGTFNWNYDWKSQWWFERHKISEDVRFPKTL